MYRAHQRKARLTLPMGLVSKLYSYRLICYFNIYVIKYVSGNVKCKCLSKESGGRLPTEKTKFASSGEQKSRTTLFTDVKSKSGQTRE